MSIRIFLIFLLFLLQACNAAFSKQQKYQPLDDNIKLQNKVTEKILSNGLKVLIKEDHRAPVVVSQIWYKVGSSYESSGITGVSHVLEHMMFKGTTKYPDDAFNTIIAENGAEDNAFTSRDYTAYYQSMEKSRLPVSFKLEADRMTNLVLREKDFIKENLVVQEERRWRTEDKPQALAYEQLYAIAFDNSGYHQPIIGWMEDLENLQLSDLQQWYQTYYSPNNAVLVVVGDVEAASVLALAEKYFGAIKADKKIKIKARVERKQKGKKEINMLLEAKLAYTIMGFKVPSVNTASTKWEPYALDLLSGILDGGDSTRLQQNLVKNNDIAATASTSYSLKTRMATLFEISAVPSSATDIDTLNKALIKEVEKLKQQPVTKEELDRIKNQIIASSVFAKDSIFYQAYQMGQAEAVGLNWSFEENYIQAVREITPEQIQQVTQKYFIEENMTIVTITPKTSSTQEKK